ncbi:MAG: carboxypeptidase regulatory-like domain-containing protein [Acidobacteria bacterium]|nr:carboxypeptidase regulatory-like domain-containing protein [Acidobacteriota bacterium]
MRKTWITMAGLAALLLVAALHLAAQSSLGSLVGSVRDSSGAVVPNVTVTVTNVATNQSRTFASGAEGGYEVTHLIPGVYRVTAESAGFKRFAVERVPLDAGAIVRVDVRLEVGQVSESIVVAEQIPAIETETSSISKLRTVEEYRKIPITFSNEPFKLYMTVPTVHSVSSSKWTFTVAGSRSGQTEFQQDGITGPNSGTPIGSISMTMEGIQEARVQGVNNAAEFGSVGIYQMVTRSGGNQFHGTGYYYHRSSALNSRDFFAVEKASNHSHYFGGSFSGPVVLPKLYNGHNRTFFVLAHDGNLSPGNENIVRTVPSLALRAGDFTGRGRLVDPLNGQPFPDNRLPATRLNPVAQRFQERFYPLPNFGPPDSLANNFRLISPAPGKENIADARIDHRLHDKNNLYVRHGWRQFPSKNFDTLLPATGPYNQLRTFRSIVVSDTHTFSPRLINEFRFGYMTENTVYRGTPLRGKDVIRALGLTGLDNVPDTTGMPSVSITGFSALAARSDNYRVYHTPVQQYTNTLTYIRGRNTFKGGLDVRRYRQDDDRVASGVFGSFQFQGGLSGQAYSDFLLGLPQVANDTPRNPFSNRRERDWFFFFQDDFKATSRLTLNLGVRYEYQEPFRLAGKRFYNFDPASGQVVISSDARDKIDGLFNRSIPIVDAPKVSFPDGGYRFADSNNVVPRLGFAYRLTSDNRTVLRGGYGFFSDNLQHGLMDSLTGGPFTPGSARYVNAIQAGQPIWQFPNAFPPSPPGASTASPSLAAANPYMRNPYVQQWNLTVERELFGMGVRTSYIGTRSTGLLYTRAINRPPASTIPFTQSRRTRSRTASSEASSGRSRWGADAPICLRFRRWPIISWAAGSWSAWPTSRAGNGSHPASQEWTRRIPPPLEDDPTGFEMGTLPPVSGVWIAGTTSLHSRFRPAADSATAPEISSRAPRSRCFTPVSARSFAC